MKFEKPMSAKVLVVPDLSCPPASHHHLGFPFPLRYGKTRFDARERGARCVLRSANHRRRSVADGGEQQHDDCCFVLASWWSRSGIKIKKTAQLKIHTTAIQRLETSLCIIKRKAI